MCIFGYTLVAMLTLENINSQTHVACIWSEASQKVWLCPKFKKKNHISVHKAKCKNKLMYIATGHSEKVAFSVFILIEQTRYNMLVVEI